MMELDSMLEKVEMFVRWVSHDDESYSVSKTCDSRMIVIVRNGPVSPKKHHHQQQQHEPQSSVIQQSRAERQRAMRSLNPDSPEFLPSSQSSSGTNLGRRGDVDENNNNVATANGVKEGGVAAPSPSISASTSGGAASNEATVAPSVKSSGSEMAVRETAVYPKERSARVVNPKPSSQVPAESEPSPARVVDAVGPQSSPPAKLSAEDGVQASSPTASATAAEPRMRSPPEQKEFQVGEVLRMVVTWIEVALTKKEGPLCFYAHFEEEESSLESMTNELTAVMETASSAVKVSPPVRTGIHVLTPHHAGWSRGLVTQLLPGSKASLFFVDYGNEEPVHWSQLFPVPPSVSFPPIFARRFRVSPSSSHQRFLLFDWLKVAPLAVVKVVAVTPDDKAGLVYDVDLLNFEPAAAEAGAAVTTTTAAAQASVVDEESRLEAALSEGGSASAGVRRQVAMEEEEEEKAAAATTTTTDATTKSTPPQTIVAAPFSLLPSGDYNFLASAKALCCGCEDLDEIFLHSQSVGPILDALDDAIAKFAENPSELTAIENLKIGGRGLSKFGDTFFRCEVVEVIDASTAVVEFIDYGNKQRKNPNEIFQSDPQWDSIPPSARGPFKLLPDKTVYANVPKVKDVLEEIISLEDEVYTVWLETDGLVKMFFEGKFLNDLVEAKLAPFRVSATVPSTTTSPDSPAVDSLLQDQNSSESKEAKSSSNSGIAGIRALETVVNSATSSTTPGDAVRLVSDLPSPRPSSSQSSCAPVVDQAPQLLQRLPTRSSSGMAAPPQKRNLDVNVPTPATVAFEASSKEVYFHLVSNGEAMAATTKALESHLRSSVPHLKRLNEPKEGDAGCAIFEEDGQPYRCRLLGNPYVRSERSNLKQLVDIVFIDFGNESKGVYVDEIFALPLSDERLGPLLDPHRNPGYAVGPYRPVADKGGPEFDDRISALLEGGVVYSVTLLDGASGAVRIADSVGVEVAASLSASQFEDADAPPPPPPAASIAAASPASVPTPAMTDESATSAPVRSSASPSMALESAVAAAAAAASLPFASSAELSSVASKSTLQIPPSPAADTNGDSHVLSILPSSADLSSSAPAVAASASAVAGSPAVPFVLPPCLKDCPIKLPIGVSKAFDISEVKSPHHFCVSLTEHGRQVQVLEDILDTAMETFDVLQDLDVGDLCAAKFSDDNQWYRAEVVGLRQGDTTAASESEENPRLAQLYFIDYGNEEEVPFLPSVIRRLPSPLANIRPFIFLCSLDKLKPVAPKWGQDAVDALYDLVVDKGCVVRCLSSKKTSSGVVHRVQIGTEENPNFIAEKLVEMGIAATAAVV